MHHYPLRRPGYPLRLGGLTMHSFSPKYLDRLTFSAEEAAALSALAEARGRQQLYIHQQPEVLESLRQAAVIESSESSNRFAAAAGSICSPLPECA